MWYSIVSYLSVSMSVLLVLLVCTHVGVNVRSFCKLGTDGTLVKLLQGNKLRDLAVMKWVQMPVCVYVYVCMYVPPSKQALVWPNVLKVTVRSLSFKLYYVLATLVHL